MTSGRVCAPVLLLALWVPLAAGCPPAQELGLPAGAPTEVVFQTEHFTYYSDEPVCEDLGSRLEEFYREATRFLGIEASGEHQYRYFYYGEGASMSLPCGPEDGAWGCYLAPTDIVGSDWLHRELVALAIAAELGTPPPFFQEGLAGVIGPIYSDGYIWQHHDVDIGAQVRGEEPVDHYAVASYTKYLLDTAGVENYLQLYAGTAAETPWPALRHQFAAAMGVPPEQTIAAWQALPGGYHGDSNLWLDECASEGIEVDGTSPVLVAPDLDCAHVPVDASRLTGTVGSYRTVELQAGEALRLVVSSAVHAGVDVRGCQAYIEGEPQVNYEFATGQPAAELWTNPGPGLYFLNLKEYVDGVSSGTTTLEVAATPWPVAATCEAAGDVPVNAGTGRARLAAEVADSGAAYAWLVPTESTRVSLAAVSFPHGQPTSNDYASGAQLCTGSCEALACADVEVAKLHQTGTPFDLAGGERYLLRVKFEPNHVVYIDIVQ